MSITVGQFRLTKTVGDMYVVHMEMFLPNQYFRIELQCSEER